MTEHELIAEALIGDQENKRITPEDLVLEVLRLMGEHLENPLECIEFREEYLPRVQAVEILNLPDLIAADCVLDSLYAFRDSAAFRALHGRARAFIERFPQLLDMGWVHVAGAIDELMERMRQERGSLAVMLH